MASTALARAERLSATLKRVREQGKNTTRRSVSAGVTVLGGVAAGFLDAKLPNLGGSTMQTSTIVGLGAVALGLVGIADDHSDYLVAAGAGALAANARDEARTYFS